MFCKHCGTELPDTAKFCTNCGKAVSQEQPAPNPQRMAPQRTPFYKAPFFWILLGLIIVAYIFMQATESKTAVEEKAPPEVIDPIDLDYSGCHIKYLRHEVEGGSSPRIRIYYEFTNNSNSEHTFDWLVFESAYQDGVELVDLIGVSGEEGDTLNAIKPGTTITVCDAFRLRNTSSPVEVEMRNGGLIFNVDLAKMTIPLK